MVQRSVEDRIIKLKGILKELVSGFPRQGWKRCQGMEME